MTRPIREIQRDLSAHKTHVARGGKVRPGSLRELEAELRTAMRNAPRRATASDFENLMVYDLTPAGQTRARPKPAPAAPRRTLTENRARWHQIMDGEALTDPDRLLALPYGAVRDMALRSLERHGQNVPPSGLDQIEELCRTRTAEVDGRAISRHVVLTTSDAYRRAFEKSLRHAQPTWRRDEVAALETWRQISPRPTAEERAAGEGGSFGLGIPVLIDPTWLIQSQDPAEALPYFTRAVLTTNAWRGISTAGATLAFKAEGAATADAAVSLAQPTIEMYAAAGDFAMSIELSQDYPNLVDEVTNGFNSAYLDMVSNYTTVGSGSSVPTGIFTAMSNQTTSPAHVKVTSAGTLAAADVRAVFGALAPRYQLNASWVMSPSMLQAVAALAAPSVSNGLAPHDYAPASQGQPARLMGRPVLVSSYAPNFANATSGTYNWMVVGDLTRYMVINRLGSVTLELIPNLPDFAGGTGRPTGQRSYYYMTRWGGGVTDLQALRILSNS